MNHFNQVVTIKVKASKNKWLIIVITHLGVYTLFSIAVSLTAINKTLLLVGLLISLLSFYYFMRLHVLLSLKKSVYNIRKDSSNKWSINCKDSEYENVLVSTTSFVSNYLIILNFIDMADNKKYTALLTPDSVKEDVFRRMKVMIRTMKDQTN